MIPLILTITIVLITSAICSMTEASLFTVPINRVRTWAKEGIRFSNTLLRIKESMHDPIATIVIINNIGNIVGSIIVGSLAADYFDRFWMGVVSGIFTFLIIVFAEILPKIVGERFADRISLIVAVPIFWLTKLFIPILVLLQFLTRPITRGKRFPTISAEEIQMIAHLGTREGILEKEEEQIIRKALALNDIRVKEVMTPRIKMFGLEERHILKDVKDLLLECPFSRIPLFKKNRDRITGLLYRTDALSSICRGKEDFPISELSREVLFVPENKPIDKLLEDLRINRSHTAIVIDEYGGTAGLVTLEDVLEELVGDIVGEEDSPEDKYIVISENEILAPGVTLVGEVNEFFNTKIENHRTISKLILDQLNRFPEPFENIEWENLNFIIEEVTSKTIEKVRIKRQPSKIESEIEE